MTRRPILAALALLTLAACTPALRASALDAALACGSPLISTAAPEPEGLLDAAACWLDRFGKPSSPTPELGAAVVEAAEATEAEQLDPSPAARARTDEALGRCRSLADG